MLDNNAKSRSPCLTLYLKQKALSLQLFPVGVVIAVTQGGFQLSAVRRDFIHSVSGTPRTITTCHFFSSTHVPPPVHHWQSTVVCTVCPGSCLNCKVTFCLPSLCLNSPLRTDYSLTFHLLGELSCVCKSASSTFQFGVENEPALSFGCWIVIYGV